MAGEGESLESWLSKYISKMHVWEHIACTIKVQCFCDFSLYKNTSNVWIRSTTILSLSHLLFTINVYECDKLLRTNNKAAVRC